MKLSIIVVSYNTCNLTRRCLNSVNFLKAEIIVVDNNSSDGSAQMVRKEFPAVRLILNSKNLGFAQAVNQALRIATGENFLLLNSDTVVKENAIEKLMEFEKKVGPVIIGARLINLDGTLQPSVFHLPGVIGAIKEFWLGKKDAFSKYLPPGKNPVEVEAVIGGAMLISRKITEKIGLLDDRYFMYFEDLDFCRRARQAGFKIYFLPQAEIIHEHGASGKALADSSNQWRRLVPSSKIYHGWLKHYLIGFILWTGQKFRHRSGRI